MKEQHKLVKVEHKLELPSKQVGLELVKHKRQVEADKLAVQVNRLAKEHNMFAIKLEDNKLEVVLVLELELELEVELYLVHFLVPVLTIFGTLKLETLISFFKCCRKEDYCTLRYRSVAQKKSKSN